MTARKSRAPWTQRSRIALWTLSAASVLACGSLLSAADDDRNDRDRNSNERQGQVIDVSQDGLTVQLNNGERQQLRANNDARVTINGRAANLRDLQPGDRVSVQTAGNDRASEIQAQRGGPQGAPNQQIAPHQQGALNQQGAANQFGPNSQNGQFNATPGAAAQNFGPAGQQQFGAQGQQPFGAQGQQPFGAQGQQQFGAAGQQQFGAPGQQFAQPQYGAAGQQFGQQQYSQQQYGAPAQQQFGSAAQPAVQGRLQHFAEHASLGVVLKPVQDGTPGVQVVDVRPGSAAQVAGIQDGDRILAIDNRPVGSVQQLVQEVHSRQPGAQVALAIASPNQQPRVVTATLSASAPAAQANVIQTPGAYQSWNWSQSNPAWGGSGYSQPGYAPGVNWQGYSAGQNVSGFGPYQNTWQSPYGQGYGVQTHGASPYGQGYGGQTYGTWPGSYGQAFGQSFGAQGYNQSANVQPQANAAAQQQLLQQQHHQQQQQQQQWQQQQLQGQNLQAHPAFQGQANPAGPFNPNLQQNPNVQGQNQDPNLRRQDGNNPGANQDNRNNDPNANRNDRSANQDNRGSQDSNADRNAAARGANDNNRSSAADRNRANRANDSRSSNDNRSSTNNRGTSNRTSNDED